MALHRRPRTRRVPRGDRLQHRAVLGHRGLPQRGRIVMVLELLIQGPGPLVPQHLDDRHQRAISRRFGDAQVEEPVAVERMMLARLHLALHLVERIRDRDDLRFPRRLRGKRRALGLDDVARTEELERPCLGLMCLGASALLVAGLHVDAGPDADLDQPFDFQRDQCLADGGTRHAELLREVALRRQARARRKLAALDQGADLVGDLPIQAAGLDAVERHGKTPRARRGTKALKRGVQGYLSHRKWSSGITNLLSALESAFRPADGAWQCLPKALHSHVRFAPHGRGRFARRICVRAVPRHRNGRRQGGTVGRCSSLTDMMGRRTHGLAMAPLYLAEIRNGAMSVTGDAEVVKDTGATQVWDGAYLPGQWVVSRAIESAMSRAEVPASAIVAIRRSHHIGCLAALAKLAADRGFVAIIANSDPAAEVRRAVRRHRAAVHAESVRHRVSRPRSSRAGRHLRVDHDSVDDAREIRRRRAIRATVAARCARRSDARPRGAREHAAAGILSAHGRTGIRAQGIRPRAHGRGAVAGTFGRGPAGRAEALGRQHVRAGARSRFLRRAAPRSARRWTSWPTRAARTGPFRADRPVRLPGDQAARSIAAAHTSGVAYDAATWSALAQMRKRLASPCRRRSHDFAVRSKMKSLSLALVTSRGENARVPTRRRPQ